MSITFGHAGRKRRMLRRVLLIAAVGVIATAVLPLWQADKGLPFAAAGTPEEVRGVVTAPVVGEYNIDPMAAPGVGSELTFPANGGYADGMLDEDECVAVPYRIGLAVKAPFEFTVDIVGRASEHDSGVVLTGNLNAELSGTADPATFSFDPAAVPDGPAGSFFFTANFCNIGSKRLTELKSVTTTLSGGNALLSRDGVFVFRGFVNMSSADGWIAIDVLKDPTANATDEQNWQYDVGIAQIAGSGPDFTFESAPLALFNLSGLTPLVDGGLGRARAAFVFRNDPSQRVLLPVQDSDGITPANAHVIVFADVKPDPTNQVPGGSGCVPQDLDNVNDRTNLCTPNYLSANLNVLFFRPGQEEEQEQAAINYYQQVKTGQDGTGESIEAALPTLQKFRERYFAPFECNSLLNEPEAVTTYYNNGDLGIGREMHCINNGCKAELACYVMNFGGRDGTPHFGDKAEAQAAVENRKPFATVAMVERQLIPGFPNSVLFIVYEHVDGDPDNTHLATAAQLDRKGYNTSIPGNCLQCHGINSRYTAHANHEVRRAIFLPFDLDSFGFFSDDPNSAFSRVRQEAAFRAQNRMVRSFSRLFQLADARELIAGWYNDDMFNGTFNGAFVPPGWSGTEQQKQLYREVYARACRTCHISYEPAPLGEGDTRVGLQFGTYQQFLDFWPFIKLRACDPSSVSLQMPNAEQTLKVFWSSSARAHLFAQIPDAFGDCAPPQHE